MHFWTVQHKDVVNILLKEKIYNPDFNYTKNSAAGSDIRVVYPKFLNCFNFINHSTLPGIIFGFKLSDNCEVTDLYNYLINNLHISTAHNFCNEDYCILKLQLNDNINLLPIDFYDFTKLAIWVTQNNSNSISLLELDSNEFNRILDNLSKGIVAPKHRSFTQIHYSHININDIVGVYPMINYKENTIMKLSDAAIKLKNTLNLS
ncbi:hypothetical protein QYZ59_15520 [Clostridium perfringens]|uniref:Uncharacterized protein n=2 Tax=Clostridium perfringens TaxID=1502 RepID=A0A8H9UX87_CLOPF|nr:hypothetical protein [Clostridium perfringens]MDU7977618.1 hypothetical protein [Clostridioides difficile]EDT15838.1 hypothetical protein AC3_A0190 [Clostridium perfringens E str. JGS1987]EGT0690851.1 hypothetical protein [Clostridium perfringens]EGT0694009.1 hypothetical protein [Clostridium perfringens]MBI6024454.1 hypothetical protein [Clostridium perfringens]